MSIPSIGVPEPAARISTLSPYDFAYWAGTFVVDNDPSDYFETTSDEDGVALVSWAAGQVGVTFPTTYWLAVVALGDTIIDAADALDTRGAVVVNAGQIAVSMGLDYVVGPINGRYFQYKTTASDWEYGAQIPGMIYGG